MRSKRNISSFQDKKNRTVVIKPLQKADLDDLLMYVNNLIAEDTYIMLSGMPLTKKYEQKYIVNSLKLMKEKKKIHLIARIGNTLVSSFEIRILSYRQSHVGEIGISVKKEFRNVGIGQQCMKILLEEAKKIGLRLLYLHVFVDNVRAIHTYQSVGFRSTGIMPGALKFKGKYVDEMTMYLSLL